LDYSRSSFSLEEELVLLEMEKELDGVQEILAKPRLTNNEKQMVLPKVQGVQKENKIKKSSCVSFWDLIRGRSLTK